MGGEKKRKEKRGRVRGREGERKGVITVAAQSTHHCHHHRLRSSVNFREERHFCPKNMYEQESLANANVKRATAVHV